MAVDCSDPAQIKTLACKLHEKGMALQVFAHAAGVLGFDLISDLTEAAFIAVMLPKVAGEAIFTQAGIPVESSFLFSSTSSVWSQIGAAHYSGEREAAYYLIHTSRVLTAMPSLCAHHQPPTHIWTPSHGRISLLGATGPPSTSDPLEILAWPPSSGIMAFIQDEYTAHAR